MKTNGTRYYLFASEKRLFHSRSPANLTHTKDLAIAAVFTGIEWRRQASVPRIGTSLAVHSTEPSYCPQFSLSIRTHWARTMGHDGCLWVSIELWRGPSFSTKQEYPRYLGYRRYGCECLAFRSELTLHDVHHIHPHTQGFLKYPSYPGMRARERQHL